VSDHARHSAGEIGTQILKGEVRRAGTLVRLVAGSTGAGSTAVSVRRFKGAVHVPGGCCARERGMDDGVNGRRAWSD
jgi:hypothetical protein